MGRCRGFNSALIGDEFGFNFASQKNHDRASIVVLMFQQSPSDARGGDSTTKATRLRFDRTAIVEFFHNSSGPFDGASGKWTIAIS